LGKGISGANGGGHGGVLQLGQAEIA